MRLFTKSAFKESLICPSRLNYFRNERYANQDITDEFLQALAEGGFQVGELAKVYYNVPEENDLAGLMHYDEPLARTNEILAQDRCTLAEGAFKFGNLFIRADIINKDGDRIELIEVKAKSWDPAGDVFSKVEKKTGKEKVVSDILPYVYDVAFQKYVLVNALREQYPNRRFQVHAALMMADKSKVADLAGINQCFKIVKQDGRTRVQRIVASGGPTEDDLRSHEHIVTPFFDVDALCDRIIAGETSEQTDVLCGMSFVPYVNEMARRYCGEIHEYTELSTRCFGCPYYVTEQTPDLADGYVECWKMKAGFSDADFSRPLLEELWGGGNTRLRGSLLKAGKYHLDQIAVEDLGHTDQKVTGLTYVDRLNVQLALATGRMNMLGELARNIHGEAYLDVPALRDEMCSWRYPLHMIDFETSAVALPFYKGMRPYEEIAFQFSHHIINRTPEGEFSIRHAGQYINVEKGKFPNFDFLRELKRQLKQDEGSIFRYSHHENTILNAIRDQLMVSREPDRNELIAFIETITHHKERSAAGKLVTVSGPRDMVDLCEIVKRFYYHPSMKGSNSIKAVLPAILNTSAAIQAKYSQPIYGSAIRSLNFSPDHPVAWISRGSDGTVENPYKKLPPVASYFPDGCAAAIEAAENSLEEVNNGGAALSAYGLLQFSDGVAADALASALLHYCELDTMAMVFIWEYFNEMVNA